MSDTPADIEREIEEARERLAGTIDLLIQRSHPKTIIGREIAQVKAHYIDPATGEPRTDNILKTVGGVVGVLAFFVVVRKITR